MCSQRSRWSPGRQRTVGNKASREPGLEPILTRARAPLTSAEPGAHSLPPIPLSHLKLRHWLSRPPPPPFLALLFLRFGAASGKPCILAPITSVSSRRGEEGGRAPEKTGSFLIQGGQYRPGFTGLQGQLWEGVRGKQRATWRHWGDRACAPAPGLGKAATFTVACVHPRSLCCTADFCNQEGSA